MARHFTSLIVAFGVVLASIPAAGQDATPGRPYRGLFRGGIADATHVLSVNGSAGAGYDTDGFLAQRELGFGVTTTPTRSRASIYNVLAGGLSYSRNSERLNLGASLSSIMRRYQHFSAITSHSASAGASFKLTKSTTLGATEAATYQPWGILFRFPELTDTPIGQSSAPSADFAAGQSAYYTYTTAANLTQQLSRRSSIALGYNYQRSDFTTADYGFRSHAGHLTLSHGLTRNLGWRVGGAYTEATYAAGPLGPEGRSSNARGYTSDTGLDYNRLLGATRRTRLSFSTGATATSQDRLTRYDATGTASLGREIGRTWSAVFFATHSVAFLESLRAPYFYDGVNASLGGLWSRRTSFSLAVGATLGQLGVSKETGQSSGFDTAYANTGFGVAISRYLAVHIDYMYYAYSLARAGFVAPDLLARGFPAHLNHHSVSVSLSAWAPILERGRRPNAAR